MNLLQIWYYHCDFFSPCQLHLYRAVCFKIYIYVFTEVVLILGFCVKCISWICPYFPLWTFCVVEFVSNVVIRPFWCLFSIAINYSHLFRYKFLGFCISGGCSKGELRGSRFFALVHLPKSWIDYSVVEFDEILIGVYFFLCILLLWWFYFTHFYQ